MAFGLQGAHDFGRQDDDVGRLAGPHQFCRLDAAHRADFHRRASLRLVVLRQVRQNAPGSPSKTARRVARSCAPPRQDIEEQDGRSERAIHLEPVHPWPLVGKLWRREIEPAVEPAANVQRPADEVANFERWRPRRSIPIEMRAVFTGALTRRATPCRDSNNKLKLHRLSRLRRGGASLPRGLANQRGLQGARLRL